MSANFKKNHYYFINNGKNQPMPGDVVYYTYSHVNIVISVSGDYMTTIGGNESNIVKKSTKKWKGNSQVGGFGRLKM
jgi:hypothetical protein